MKRQQNHFQTRPIFMPGLYFSNFYNYTWTSLSHSHFTIHLRFTIRLIYIRLIVIIHFSKTSRGFYFHHMNLKFSLAFMAILWSGPLTFLHFCRMFISLLLAKSFQPRTFHLYIPTHLEHPSFQWSFRIPVFKIHEITNTQAKRECNVNRARGSAAILFDKNMSQGQRDRGTRIQAPQLGSAPGCPLWCQNLATLSLSMSSSILEYVF